ncbi:MAG: sodium/solute symporter [Candidatus Hydrogenedentes bacterium]|nr:sodium/solute symporter [Candidatus Hydrogenedentota bacterium]
MTRKEFGLREARSRLLQCMRRGAGFALCLIVILTAFRSVSAQAEEPARGYFAWDQLPALPLPLREYFSGVVGDALVVAGGVYADDHGTEVVSDSIYCLDPNRRQWQMVKRDLPDSLVASGAAATTTNMLICIGGRSQREFLRTVSAITFDGHRGTHVRSLPDLPNSCALAGAATLGSKIYVAGGLSAPDAPEPLRSFWELDLNQSDPRWNELEPLPESGRIRPVIVAQSGSLYLFGGSTRSVGGESTELQDAYRYSPGQGWRRVADVPHTMVAATAFGPSHVLTFGSENGTLNASTENASHQKFQYEVLAYHVITDTWTSLGTVLPGIEVAHAFTWRSQFVLMGTEQAEAGAETRGLLATFSKRTSGFRWSDYVVLLLYFAGVILIGVYIAPREKSTEDFFLGGRRVPWWAVGLSIFGTSLSSITYLSIPAKAYATDWVFILVNLGILLMAPCVVWFYLPHYRRFTITTAYEYLERRFNRLTRIYGSLVFIIFQIGRISIVLYLPSMALSAATGLDVNTCILLMGILTTIYTALGGIEAVIWTDVVQCFVLLLGAVIVFLIVSADVEGGMPAVLSIAHDAGKFHTFNWTWDPTTTAVWVAIVGNFFANAYPMTADQCIVQRYLTTATERGAARAIWTNAWLTIPVSLIFFGLGTALFVFYKAHPERLDPTLRTDAILPLFIVQQLPGGLAGLVIGGLFAAAMSTLDSSLNSVATVLITDFYRPLRPNASDATALALARRLTWGLGAIGTGTALILAHTEVGVIFDFWLQILGLVGSGLAGLFALGMLTRRATGSGALMGAAVSAAVVIGVQQSTQIHFFLYAAIGFITSFVVGYVVSFGVRVSGLGYRVSGAGSCRFLDRQ